nr:retrovirus-related Pol polyprotein from transposon TNT 1-94 [Tanacetum cinerariifolium]
MDIIEFYASKGIKREYSNAKTLQQNGVAERKNITSIKAARTMLANSFLPNTFWAEAISTTCYVLNRVLVTKPQNKTPYELITGKILIISYIRPFGCHVTILNTIDHLSKFEEKSDERFLVGYSLNSKAFRVYNLETKRVEENLHINFLENKPNVAGKGPTWMFYLDYLTDSINYQPVTTENKANKTAGPKEANNSAGAARASSTNYVNTASTPVNTASPLRNVSVAGPSYLDLLTYANQDDSQIPSLEDIYDVLNDGIFTSESYDDDEGAVADIKIWKLLLNPKRYLKHLKIKVGLMLCRKSCCNSRLNKFGFWLTYLLGRRQEEKIDYDEVFAPMARIEAIKIFLAFASYIGFIVYQMDVKSASLYGKIDEEVYVSQPSYFIHPKFPKKVYKVVKALTHRQDFVHKEGQEGYYAGQAKKDGIFISQDKYVAEILKKFDFMSVKTASTLIKTKKPLVQDGKAVDVDVHLYRYMIGSLMYLTAFNMASLSDKAILSGAENHPPMLEKD